EWIATDEGLLKVADAAQTTFVPGHGEVAKAADVRGFVDYLAALRAETSAGLKAGLSGDALRDTVVARLKTRFPDWSYVPVMAPREVGYMTDELQ
ncbi:hypothetical protein ACKI1S_47520, partial [Streptomyces galilaeus]